MFSSSFYIFDGFILVSIKFSFGSALVHCVPPICSIIFCAVKMKQGFELSQMPVREHFVLTRVGCITSQEARAK